MDHTHLNDNTHVDQHSLLHLPDDIDLNFTAVDNQQHHINLQDFPTQFDLNSDTWANPHDPLAVSTLTTVNTAVAADPWSTSVPYFAHYEFADYNTAGQRYLSPPQPQAPISSPSPAAFHTPLSDSYLLTAGTPSPYAYHASSHPHQFAEPIQRSMSVSALSNTERSSVPSRRPSSFLPAPRQIRFVSSDGHPHTKRRRINAACLTCRKRKTRCSGERPECKTCTENGHICAGYADRPDRRELYKRSADGDEDDEDEDDVSGTMSPKRRKSGSTPSHTHQGVDVVPTPSSSQHVDTSNNGAISRTTSKVEPDVTSPESTHTVGSSSVFSSRNRVPFFRYFGPTAIVPGFKQMVVQVKDHRMSATSISAESPVSGLHGENSSVAGREPSPQDIPVYDATDTTPNPPLITHLCETFFTHLGCNYPFLQRERFLKDLEEKKVDVILVDAVCAVAARFSSDPILTKLTDPSLPLNENGEIKRAFRGQPFSQRAISAVVETFSCPTIAVAQACLLLAYEEFGTDRDSGLWMYLGTSIRMAQDLGIQKLEGMQIEGRLGPTPKTAKHGDEGKLEERDRVEQQKMLCQVLEDRADSDLDNRRSSEQERIDTFWSIFFLDRAVSSGVGRPVTLRDKDIEISFPYRPDEQMINGYPHPFPAMIRIVHMYGRVADVLNNIKQLSQVTPAVLQRLAGMEKDLTGIYQRLSPKLHFNATNFQHYVKAEQGTNFILLHFWFHTLIVLLHQPTLLHSFEGRIQQLFPDSRELSMSSAKTIADILAFAELIDVKSFIGNPFTSQPMYIAACAFLAEAAAHASQPPSRQTSPPRKANDANTKTVSSQDNKQNSHQKTTKHSLLATAANQNYQRCYKALKVLDSYWAGCRYILTALDQKSKGLMDPLLFTSEDIDGEMPSTEPSFTTPGWRRSSHGALSGSTTLRRASVPWSTKMDWNQAIGWSLTGTANSPAPNISVLYSNPSNDSEKPINGKNSNQDRHLIVSKSNSANDVATASILQGQMSQPRYEPNLTMMAPPRTRISSLPYDPVSTAEADLLLGLHSPYSVTSGQPTSPQSTVQTYDYGQPQTHPLYPKSFYTASSGVNPSFSDMLIESQDIDMSSQPSGGIAFNNVNFPGGDMIPWLEYLPQDVLSYFGDAGGSEEFVTPSGPGPPTAPPDPGGPMPGQPNQNSNMQ